MTADRRRFELACPRRVHLGCVLLRPSRLRFGHLRQHQKICQPLKRIKASATPHRPPTFDQHRRHVARDVVIECRQIPIRFDAIFRPPIVRRVRCRPRRKILNRTIPDLRKTADGVLGIQHRRQTDRKRFADGRVDRTPMPRNRSVQIHQKPQHRGRLVVVQG